ncbi:unnamed protein product [Hermetia illucens]|uniref:3'(2'),5'-bisphosphate nucleotidase 1 n=1 Tax=Hermetia illucens TaxID=343691 RepID=A0A7R8YWM2_HERIL|nr:3'(2'),5'-bisphosphate nucleotidase 1 [Hermetia illucens]CAD7084960.1 unnamed protein product [Hermetia illucens]
MAFTSAPLMMRIMASSISSARRAGVIIRDIMKTGELGIVDKGKDDPQTEADRTAQQCIVASLTKLFPSVKIIGEEGACELNVAKELIVTELDTEFLKNKCPDEWSNVPAEDLVIWVDPLDGTSEYTQGFVDHVTVLIGIAVKNAAVGGVIHQPYYKNSSTGELGRTIWGLRGLGIGGFTPKDAPSDKFIVTTTRSHSNATVQCALDAMQPTEVLRVGGAGYKVLQLLEGKAHAYVFASAGCKKWDTCAPEAVLEAAGGTLTDMLGQHYVYHKDVEFPNRLGVLATSRTESHTKLVERIPHNVREAMQSK